MNKILQDQSGENPVDASGLSMVDLFLLAWQEKWKFIGITAVTVALCLIWMFVNTRYMAEGIFEFGGEIPMPIDHALFGKLANFNHDQEANTSSARGDTAEQAKGIKPADFQRYLSAVSASNNLAEFAHEHKLTEDEIRILQPKVSSPGSLIAAIVPLYTSITVDPKSLPSKQNSGRVVAFRVLFHATHTPETARRGAELLGYYVMDGIAKQAVKHGIEARIDYLKLQAANLNKLVAEGQASLEEQQEKGQWLKNVAARHPAMATHVNLQIINVTKDNVSYLPLPTQIVAVEVQAGELVRELKKSKRGLSRNSLLLAYYGGLDKLLQQPRTGRSLVLENEKYNEQFFKEKSSEDHEIRKVYRNLKAEIQLASDVYFVKSRFVEGNNLQIRSTFNPVPAVATGILLGLLLSLAILALLRRKK